jgi:DNA-binding IclR family transcriptional regulator
MEMVVIAGVEAPGLIGFAVRVGYRRPLHRSASGRVLLAFQSAEGRREMIDEIREGGELIDDHTLAIELDTIASDGGCVAPSPVITGITDLSAPVRIAGQARAALTVPFVHGHDAHVDLASLRAAVWSAAMRIANQLVPPA